MFKQNERKKNIFERQLMKNGGEVNTLHQSSTVQYMKEWRKMKEKLKKNVRQKASPELEFIVNFFLSEI
jgi:hypothetical protein